MNQVHKAISIYNPLVMRPARKQASEIGGRNKEPPSGTVYNIWYNKWAGGDRFTPQTQEKAETRCIIAKDSGYTRATRSSSFCIHFARGACARGADCNFWHRIPLEIDRVPMAQDVFGRDKFKDEKEDMGGVGSFEKEARTLYVGQLGVEGGLEDILYKHFVEWGEIEYLRYLTGKGVAFIRYRTRINAEFAKEAMQGQSLDSNEVINVRWANEDPNPKAAAVLKRKYEEQVMEAMKGSLPVIGEHGTLMDYQNHYPTAADAIAAQQAASQLPASKRVHTTTGAEGWDTPHGFFYASNEQASLTALGPQAQAQAQQQTSMASSNLVSTGYFDPSTMGSHVDEDEATPAPWTGFGPDGAPMKVHKQSKLFGAAEYVVGVGNSRWYSGVGQPHYEARVRMQEAARAREKEREEAAARLAGVGVVVQAPNVPLSAAAVGMGASAGGTGVDGTATSQANLLEGSSSTSVQTGASSTETADQSQHQPQPPQTANEAYPEPQQTHINPSIHAAPPVPAMKLGVLSEATIQYLASMAQHKKPTKTTSPPAKPAPASLVADYDSD